MPRLEQALHDWNTDHFARTLKREVEGLEAGILPLAKAVNQGGYVDESRLEVTVINSHDAGETIQARMGVFFTEIVICCGCGDDPMPTNAYCELQLSIDKASAEAVFAVIQE